MDDGVVGSIGAGLAVLVGVTDGDSAEEVAALADKLSGLRIFEDGEGAMNLSVRDVGGEILVVSQFTLYADARRGRRPSFVRAARPEVAEPLIGDLVDRLQEGGIRVGTGSFGAKMEVELVNDGPITVLLESRDGKIL